MSEWVDCHECTVSGESVSLGIVFGTSAHLADSVAMPQTVPGPLHYTTPRCSALHCCALIPACFFFFFPVAHLSPAMFQRAGLRGLEAGSVPVARGRLLSPSHGWPTECTLVLTLALVVDAHTQMQKHKCVVQTHTHTRTLSYAHAHTRS